MRKMPVLILFVTVFAACRRDDPGMPSPQARKITDKWNIITVTVIPHDPTGKTINDGTVYTEPSYYYFQFNANFTWVENLAPNVNPIGESGTYTLLADTAFTLVNEHVPSQPEECKIVALTDTTFIFSHQRATLYNGITPGFLEYVFKLKK